MNLVIYDTETTGQLDHEPIMLAMQYWANSDKHKTICFHIKPEKPCLPCAIVVHGITKEIIDKSHYPIKEEAQTIFNFLKKLPRDTYYAAYNDAFDISVIHNMFEKHINKTFQPKNSLDILRFARKMIDITEIGNHKLDTVYYFLFPDRLNYLQKARQSHDATTDTELTSGVFLCLWKRLEKKLKRNLILKEVAEWVNEPYLIELWPWGKHKGDKISDMILNVPDYIQWFMKQPWKDEARNNDLVYSIDHYMNSK